MNKDFSGHLAALLTIFIWGTTFISTKILLTDFKPIEILFFRFLIGLFILILIYPKRLRKTTKKQELTFALTGLCGVTLYYLLENIALTYSMASNIGVIISIAPFFTRFSNPIYLGNILFLGLGASALCFVTWNMAVKILGAVKTSIYIYIVPVVTVVTSIIVLHEQITLMAFIGTVLTLIGLFLSQKREVQKNG